MQHVVAWSLAAMEAGLLCVLWRNAVGPFPAFFVYTAINCGTQICFALGLWNASLFVQVLITPLKILVVWEAISLRLRFVQDGTPRTARGELYWLVIAASGVALMLMSIASLLPIQYNVPQLFGRMRTQSELAFAAVLGISWLYARLRPPRSPRRSEGHLTLLFAWFAVVTPNLFAVGRGEAELWEWISIGGMVAKAGIVAGWIWLFRFRESRKSLESTHLFPDAI